VSENSYLYGFVCSAIKPEFANLFQELCDEQVLANIDPEAVKSKKKQRKLDFEVSELRLKIATSQKNIVLSNREIRLLRHVELTDEDKERLRGSYKVAKKLEKLEGKQKDSDDDDSENNNELELPSLESISSEPGGCGSTKVFSPTSDCGSDIASQPTSLTDSMALVNKILANGNLDRLERIEKLEAILTDVTSMALNSRSSSTQHINLSGLTNGYTPTSNKVDAETQTISTGDISFTKVYSPSKSASPPS
jgi:exonuclease 3'-5' domain-containing protein 1